MYLNLNKLQLMGVKTLLWGVLYHHRYIQ